MHLTRSLFASTPDIFYITFEMRARGRSMVFGVVNSPQSHLFNPANMSDLKTYFKNLSLFATEFINHRHVPHSSDDEENMDEDEEKIAVAATFGISTVFRAPRSPGKAKNTQSSASPNKGPSQQNVDRERLTVDISALKQQYSKLRQRQKQAQIILSSAMTKHLPSDGGNLDHSAGGPPVAMNHLLLGKKPLVMSKPRRGIIPGSVPAPKNASNLQGNKTNSGGTNESAPDPGRLERMVGSKPRHPHLPCSKVSMASSSTEHCVGGSDDETENATDLEELPRDLDVASLKSECESRHFAESLMRDFDST
eukprot:maker-scaffold249_size238305-snap-gene-1.10 protein:Tk01323 transcript:maker-scaffold249_size238305-snap-gene-1.10-mRNA-1 annotation:"PREDICTED: uncharacterized protein LOC410363 isoform X7"